jgi:hypothetical protein
VPLSVGIYYRTLNPLQVTPAQCVVTAWKGFCRLSCRISGANEPDYHSYHGVTAAVLADKAIPHYNLEAPVRDHGNIPLTHG